MTSKPKPILTIVRGLPGSGKSSYVRKLADETGAMIIEPDALLVVGGEYYYTPERYRDAVQRCFCILSSLGAERRDIIYADVLPRMNDVYVVYDEYNHYLPTTKAATVRVIDMPLLTVDESMARNRHAVRRKDIERMAREWEPWEEKNDD